MTVERAKVVRLGKAANEAMTLLLKAKLTKKEKKKWQSEKKENSKEERNTNPRDRGRSSFGRGRRYFGEGPEKLSDEI
jgi:hypothetical protein